MDYNFVLVYEEDKKIKTYLGQSTEDIREMILVLKKSDKRHKLGRMKMYYMTYRSIYGENF